MKKRREVRLEDTQSKYQAYLDEERPGCPFCFQDGLPRKVLQKFEFWYITENLFPYDRYYSVSHMLVPHRHVHHSWELSDQEILELLKIRQILAQRDNYDELLENFPKARTQIHFHMHLLAY